MDAKNEQTNELTNEQLRAIIDEIVNTNEKYKSCYFWSARGTTASQRRREEFDEKYDFVYAGHEYHVQQSLSISCADYYYSLRVEKDGRKTNITPLNTILRKL